MPSIKLTVRGAPRGLPLGTQSERRDFRRNVLAQRNVLSPAAYANR